MLSATTKKFFTCNVCLIFPFSIFLFSLCLHQSKWTKGTRSISCSIWAETDGRLLDWCWYTSCGRTEGRWHVYHRQSTDLRTEYTRCRQTTGWVCFIYQCHTNHHFVLPINATFQLMLNMCLCYCKNTLFVFGRSVSLHLFNFSSCCSSKYVYVYWPIVCNHQCDNKILKIIQTLVWLVLLSWLWNAWYYSFL